MFFGTILICSLEALACSPDNANRAIIVPAPFPTMQACYLGVTQFAATNAVPLGRLLLVCGTQHMKLNSVPV